MSGIRQRIALIVAAEGARRAAGDIDQTSDATRRLGNQTDRTSRQTRNARGEASRFQRTLRGVGNAAKYGAAAGIAGLSVAAIGGFKALARVDRIGRQTAAVIKSTGGTANVSRAHIEGLAGQLERLTATEAESIQEGQNMLLTFTNIANGVGKGNDIFDQSTRILVDMSRALVTDAKKSAVGLGKALNDPIKGVTALSKVGVSFTADQKKQIATLVESGKTMEAQKIILAELNKEFGGSGAAYGQSTAGQWELIMAEVGNLQEMLAGALMPTLRSASIWARKFVQEMVDGTGSGGRFRSTVESVAGGVGKAAGAIASGAGVVKGIVKDFRDGKPAAVALGVGLGAVVAGFLAFKTVMFVITVVRSITFAVWGMNAALAANPVGLVIAAVAALAVGLYTAYQKVGWFRTGVNAVWGALKVAWAWLAANGPAILKYIPLVALIRNWGRVKSAGVGAFNAIKETVGSVAKWIGDKIQSIIDAVQNVIDKIKSVPGVGAAIGAAGDGASAVKDLLGFAKGGRIPRSGPVLVGEEGPEIYDADGGAYVSSNDDISGGGGPRRPGDDAPPPAAGAMLELHVHSHVDGREVGKSVRKVALRDLLAAATATGAA